MPDTHPTWEAAPQAATEIFGERLPLAQAYHDSLATTAAERGFIGPKEVSLSLIHI